MDRRARELLDGMENIESSMVQYIKDNTSRLPERILVYEIRRGIFDRFGRKFYLNTSGTIDKDMVNEESRMVGGDTFSVDSFAREYPQAMKDMIRKLGEELDKFLSDAPV